jgi:hypothetical protein
MAGTKQTDQGYGAGISKRQQQSVAKTQEVAEVRPRSQASAVLYGLSLLILLEHQLVYSLP